MTTFKYTWSEKIKQLMVGVGCLVIINSLLSKDFNWEVFFLVTFGFTLLLFFMLYSQVLFEKYKVGEEGIEIARLSIFNRKIPFKNIKRIIVRDGEVSIFGKNTIMTIILNTGKKKRIIISALENSAAFIQLLEQQSSFKTIQQDNKGNILKAL